MKHFDTYLRAAWDDIDFVDVRSHRTQGKMTLDVRDADELRRYGWVEGTLHIPRGRLEIAADPLEDMANSSLLAAKETNSVIHVISNNGRRSVLATKTLVEMGYRAKSVKGGIRALRQDERNFPNVESTEGASAPLKKAG